MMKKIKTFIRLQPQLKIMILQAIALSIYTGFLFAFLNRYVKFGKKTDLPSYSSFPKESFRIKGRKAETPERKANNIAKAIQIVNKYIPWKNVCRHQAYQAKLLCNFYRIPCLIFIGFKKDNEKNEIQAHAWTIAGGKMITGFCDPEEYVVQSIYRNKWQ
ncbi:lasso peptide biosynthesis B2 protein [Niabella aquatica]